MKLSTLLMVGLCSLGLAISVHGQTVSVGSRLRVQSGPLLSPDSRAAWKEVEVVAVGMDSVWYESEGGRTVSLSTLGEDAFLEHGRGAAGVIVGAAVGGVVGGIVADMSFKPGTGYEGATTASSPSTNYNYWRFPARGTPSREANSRMGSILGGVALGAISGGVFGWLVGQDSRTWVPLSECRIRGSPGAFVVTMNR